MVKQTHKKQNCPKQPNSEFCTKIDEKLEVKQSHGWSSQERPNRGGRRSLLAVNAECKLKLRVGYSMVSLYVWGRNCMAIHRERASEVSSQLRVVGLGAR